VNLSALDILVMSQIKDLQNSYGRTKRVMLPEIYLVVVSLAAVPIPSVPATAGTVLSQDPCFSDSISPDQRIAACTTLIRSSKRDPESKASALLRRAGAYGLKSKYARAAADATEAIKQARSAVAYYTRALAYHDMGRERQAIQDCDAALMIEPDNENALFVRGTAREGLADYTGATQDFSDVLRLDPGRADAWFSRGATYYSAGNYDAAVEDFSKTIELGHADATVFYLRGLARLELGEMSDARADLNEAMRLDPKLRTGTPLPGGVAH
jgi:tetratricopeptide (TPR) repeat protein